MYMTTREAGQLWIIPAEMLDVQEVWPLSLNDLAINDTVELDKRTVAGIVGVPAFFLGVGEFDAREYNSWINNRILPLAISKGRELTRKLLYSSEISFKLDPIYLYDYEMTKFARVVFSFFDRCI